MEYVIEYRLDGDTEWKVSAFYSGKDRAVSDFIARSKDSPSAWRLTQLTAEEMSLYIFRMHPANL